MKFISLIGVTAAVKLDDAPVYFNEPTWKQTWPSASGLVQLDEQVELTACEQNPQPGVICDKANSGFFANGMIGNEDLKQDISMKNVPYEYAQRNANEKDITDRQTKAKCNCMGSGCEECVSAVQVARKGDEEEDIEAPSGCACDGKGLCQTCINQKKNDGCYCDGKGTCKPMSCDGKHGGNQNLVQTGDYTDTMGYSTYVHPYFPGQFPPNFAIKQGGKCLTWILDSTGRIGNDQNKLEFATCKAGNHQQYFNFQQMSRTIRAYSRQNYAISNIEGANWSSPSYEAVLRPWRKEEYNIIDFDLNAKCTMMNMDGEHGMALTTTNGALGFSKCTGSPGQKYTISPLEPGNGSYPSK